MSPFARVASRFISCADCGAVVEKGMIRTHKAWHELVNQNLIEIAEEIARLKRRGTE